MNHGWRSPAFGASALGACAAIVVAAGAACSQSYAEDAKADGGAAPEASAAEDATVEAATADADVADTSPPKPPTFTVLASGLGTLNGIAATEQVVYFIEDGKSALLAVPIGGGTASTVFTTSDTPNSIVADGAYLFWSQPGAVGRVSSAGGADALTSMPVGSASVAIAASSGALVALASAGPTAGILQQFDVGVVAGAAIVFAGSPEDVAYSGSAFYWTETGGRVATATFGSTTSAELAMNETGCGSIAANATDVYWTRPSGGLVRSANRLASGAPITLTAGETAPSSIAADDTNVYWLTGDGKVRRKTIGQELPPATLASGFASAAFAGKHVRALALTSMYVVWITTDGRILRTDK
jgi:hypothetical protein